MKRSFKLKAIHRIAGIITLVAVIGFSFTACDDGGGTGGSNTTVVGVTGVTLNKSSLSLDVGDTETLTATVTPGNATNKAVSWSTSNAAVATVANGVVTAVAPGSATITVTTADGGKTAACSVTVTEDGTTGVPVTGVTLNKSSLSLTVGGTETLTATVAPSNATNKAVTWSTSNAAVATVANGVVTAVAAGSAVITVTTADGSKTAACSVTVTASGPKSIFTLTDIPSQYNGVYMIVSADDNKSFYGFTIANSLLPEIKDGKARAALYEDLEDLLLGLPALR